PDPRAARPVPGVEVRVRPWALHRVGGGVEAVRRPVEQEVGPGRRRVRGALPDAVAEVAGGRLDAEPGRADLLTRQRAAQHVELFAGQLALAGDVPAEGG